MTVTPPTSTLTPTPESSPTQATPSVEATPTVYDPFAGSTPTPAPEEDVDEDVAEDVAEEQVEIDFSPFQDRITEIVGDVDGELEIVVALSDGLVIYDRDSDGLMEAASLYKLAIMVELFRQREAQELAFDDEIVMLPDYFLEQDDIYDWSWIGTASDLGSLLVSMIAYSSNVAAAALLARLGNDAINDTMDDLGLYDTRIRWTPGIWVPAGVSPGNPTSDPSQVARRLASTDQPERNSGTWQSTLRSEQALNVTTAADVAALFAMLLNGDVVSPEASEEMLDLLARQVVNDRLPRYLPEGTTVAHKTGNWDGLVHDAGVIWAPSGPIIVVVMSDIFDEGRATDIIASIALEAYLLEH